VNGTVCIKAWRRDAVERLWGLDAIDVKREWRWMRKRKRRKRVEEVGRRKRRKRWK